MRLKRLVLQGYKTFATKTEFVFDEGITSIVGPNGSGKSNIADAVRWVLGEQSYTSLRGKRTTDMIFAGSRSRPRAGMAQVILTLDNSQGWLPIDFSEVEIGRRAHRSGENEYILNGQKVRLKDINELLATSGLAERTYTIIGQGVVDSVLSIRADERRALFEEAAGISHYKAKRAQTLRRLEETKHNLERVHDILAEIRPRMTSLRRQATRARNYEQVAADLRQLLLIWYGHKWESAKEELRRARLTVDSVEASWQQGRQTLQRQLQQMDEIRRHSGHHQRRIAEMSDAREGIRVDLEQARRQLAVLEERRQSRERRLAELEGEEPALIEQRAAAAAEVAQAIAELEEAQQDFKQNQELLQQFDSARTLASQQAEVEELRRQRAAAQKDRAERGRELERLRRALREQEQQLHVLRRDVARFETRVDLLDQLRPGSVTDHQDAELVGTFANLITVPKQYERAIATALGNRIATLVASDPGEMWRLLDSNSDAEPLSAVALDRVRSPSPAQAPNHSAVIGWASNLIQCEPSVRPLVRLLLGRTLLVTEDPRTAYRIARQVPEGSLVVTLDGFVAHASGLVERGTRDLLHRDRSHETEWQKAAHDLKEAQSALAEFERDFELQQASVEAKQSHVDELLQAEERLRQLEFDASQLHVEAQQQRQMRQQAVSAAQTIVAGRQAVVDSRRATLDQVDMQLNTLKESRSSLQPQKLAKALAAAETQVNQLVERLEQVDADLEPLRKSLNESQKSLAQLEEEASVTRQQEHQRETQYTQVKVAFSQKKAHMEGLIERINADLGIVALSYDEEQTGPTPLPMTDVVELLPQVTEIPDDLEENIHHYRGQLQRMGSINPDAPAEYEATQNRYEFLTQQVEDLEKTEARLRRIIAELDDLTSRAFANTFEKVNDVFGVSFTELFGGGSARLTLTDPDDLINSGVDIIARLPNRREQGLAMLSGGERSLTAVALIFSLLKVSPTPFCVLDEVDAALDEANINRFREMLRDLSLKTQFVIITHNRGTVQSADTLYGISMGADSASQAISMRPEEYVKQASLV